MIAKFYKYFQALSLDIVIGTVSGSIFIFKLLQIPVHTYIVLGLAMVVWIIYTFDHLLDALNSKHLPTSFRHSFHYKNKNFIILFLVILSVIGLIILKQIPYETIQLGLIVSTFCVVYFIILQFLRHKIGAYKEFSIAFIYALGIFTGPVSIDDNWMSHWPTIIIFYVLYFLVTYACLLIFSLFDRESDEKDGYKSTVSDFGVQSVKRMIDVMLSFCFLLLFVGLLMFPSIKLYYFAFSTLLISILVIYTFPKIFSKNTYYRIIGDLAYSFPVLVILLYNS